jgi:hypothetical protein
MVVRQPSKLVTWVRFPSPAPRICTTVKVDPPALFRCAANESRDRDGPAPPACRPRATTVARAVAASATTGQGSQGASESGVEGGRSRPPPCDTSVFDVLDLAEEAMNLVIDPRRKEQRVRVAAAEAAAEAVAESQTPKAADLDRRAGLALQLAAKPSVRRERIDPTIAEVTGAVTPSGGRQEDVLQLGVVVERVRSELPADARLLETAERRRHANRAIGVDRDGPGFECSGDAHRAARV